MSALVLGGDMDDAVYINNPKTFGQWIIMHLNDLEMTQKEFAKQIAVSQQTVCTWCLGRRKPSVDNFFWICRVIAVLKGKDLDEQEIKQIEVDIVWQARKIFIGLK